MPTFHELSVVQLKQAVHLREQIESLQEKLDALLGGTPKQKLGRPVGKKRTMSAESRAKMAAGQKARWAKIHEKPSTKVASNKATSAEAAVSKKATPTEVAPKKKVMSPEAKAKIAAAMKARWAAKKKGETAVAK